MSHVLNRIAHDAAVQGAGVLQNTDEQAAVAEVVDAQRDAAGKLVQKVNGLPGEEAASGAGALEHGPVKVEVAGR